MAWRLVSGVAGRRAPFGLNIRPEWWRRIRSNPVGEQPRLLDTPVDFTWHHVEDGKPMMLVPKKLHGVVNHTGGTAAYKHATGIGKYGN